MKKNNPLTSIEWTTCWMSIRYAMNRQSAASASLPTELLRAYYYRWNDVQRDQIAKDLEEHWEMYGRFGDRNIDHPIWMKFWYTCDVRQHFEVVLKNDCKYTVFECEGVYWPVNKWWTTSGSGWYIIKEDVKNITK